MSMLETIYPAIEAFPPLARVLAPLLQVKDTLSGGTMHRYMERVIPRFRTPEQMADRRYMRRLRRDMWYSVVRYRCIFQEYFLFHFERLSPAGRREFIGDLEKNHLCAADASRDSRQMLRNKWSTYERLRPYYRRDAVKVDKDLSLEEFTAFVEKHPRFIVKPLEECFGYGVHFEDRAAGGESIPQMLARLAEVPAIAEAPIVQSEAMARFHPQSINTIRSATYRRGEQVDILFTFFRMGRGGSIVDNAGAGGFVALVDVDTGVLTTPGITERLETVILHPDTGEQIIGARIPRWEEMKALSVQLGMAVPEQAYVSWDLALTDEGWVVVEANHAGQFVCPQFTTQRGVRPLISRYFKDCRP